MRYVLMIAAVILAAFIICIFFTPAADDISGESTVIGNSFVMAEYGYAIVNNRLLYAVIRTFPTNATDAQKSNDPRYRQTQSGVLIRDNRGQMIPVGRNGTVYMFDGDQLRTMKVKVREDDFGIDNCTNLDQMWSHFQQFAVHQ